MTRKMCPDVKITMVSCFFHISSLLRILIVFFSLQVTSIRKQRKSWKIEIKWKYHSFHLGHFRIFFFLSLSIFLAQLSLWRLTKSSGPLCYLCPLPLALSPSTPQQHSARTMVPSFIHHCHGELLLYSTASLGSPSSYATCEQGNM